MARRVKGGQKLIGPRKKVPLATRAANARRAGRVLGKGVQGARAVANPGKFVVNKLTGGLQQKLAEKLGRGAGKLLGKGINRFKGLSPKPTPQRKTAPKRKTATLGSRSMRRTRK